jgi:hypothetical protein
VPKPNFRKAKGADSYSSTTVQKDFKLLSSPVLHMFRYAVILIYRREEQKLTERSFRRVIADEFTYLEKKSLAALLRLSSCYKWVLSGTPPVSDFPAIRRYVVQRYNTLC